MKTWLITGCSSGLGRALCESALAHGDQVVMTARDVDTISGRESVRTRSRRGGRLPLHATGVGKVLLAHAPPEVLTATRPASSIRAPPRAA